MDSQVWAAPRLIEIVISIPGGRTVELDPAFLGRPVGCWASWGRLPSQPVEFWRGVTPHSCSRNISEPVQFSHVTFVSDLGALNPELPALRAPLSVGHLVTESSRLRQENFRRKSLLPVISYRCASAQFSRFVVLRKIFNSDQSVSSVYESEW